MENRDDKLIALIGLLSACLISVVFLFAMTWFSDVHPSSEPRVDSESCYVKDVRSARS